MKQFTGDVTGGMRFKITIEDDHFITWDDKEAQGIVQGAMNDLFCDLIAQEQSVKDIYMTLNRWVMEQKQKAFSLYGGKE